MLVTRKDQRVKAWLPYSAINDLSFSLQKLPQKHNSGYKDVRMQGRIMVTLKKIQLGALVFMYFFEEMVS